MYTVLGLVFNICYFLENFLAASNCIASFSAFLCSWPSMWCMELECQRNWLHCGFWVPLLLLSTSSYSRACGHSMFSALGRQLRLSKMYLPTISWPTAISDKGSSKKTYKLVCCNLCKALRTWTAKSFQEKRWWNCKSGVWRST